MPRVGISGGGSPPPPARPGGGGGPLPGGAEGADRGGCGGCRVTGGGFRRGPPGEGGALDADMLEPPEDIPAESPDMPPPPPPPLAIQSDLIGGGAGVLTVATETSPMMRSASLQA